MSYAAYVLIVLVLAGTTYSALWVVGLNPSFESIAKRVATVVFWLPVVVWMAFVFSCFVAMGVAMLALALHLLGFLSLVRSWPMWSFLPTWVWFLLAVGLSYVGLHAYYWLKAREGKRTSASV
jgi:hypothetical protein